MADGYEIYTEWYSRFELSNRILTKIKEGWKVLYTIHMPNPPPTPQQYSNIPTCTSVMNPDGSITSSICVPPPISSSYFAEPMIEVMYYKKNWEKDPCPRCSFPYPDQDQLAREE